MPGSSSTWSLSPPTTGWIASKASAAPGPAADAHCLMTSGVPSTGTPSSAAIADRVCPCRSLVSIQDLPSNDGGGNKSDDEIQPVQDPTKESDGTQDGDGGDGGSNEP